MYLDALAHHPYPFGSPRRHALNIDDVVIPDFARLSRPLAVAVRAGNVLPRGSKQLWATEISWDTRPPDPGGIPAHKQARYLEGALNVLWKEGVDVVTWYLLRDEARGRGYLYTLQSGIFLRGATVARDRRKPSFEGFRFPFTAYRTGARAELWGLAPGPGPVTIQIRRGRAWRHLVTLRAGSNRVFLGHRRVAAGTLLRARWKGQASLSWKVF